MERNQEFCRPTSNGLQVEYAPWVIPPSPARPTEEQYNAAGWYKNAIEPPSPPAGKILVSRRYEVRADGKVVAVYTYSDPPPPTLEDFDVAMESHLFVERSTRGYTTREPDAYFSSAVPRWAQDARDWVAHRDAVMGYALELINAVQSGEREAPTMAEFVAGLPTIEWTFPDPEEDSEESDTEASEASNTEEDPVSDTEESEESES